MIASPVPKKHMELMNTSNNRRIHITESKAKATTAMVVAAWETTSDHREEEKVEEEAQTTVKISQQHKGTEINAKFSRSLGNMDTCQESELTDRVKVVGKARNRQMEKRLTSRRSGKTRLDTLELVIKRHPRTKAVTIN